MKSSFPLIIISIAKPETENSISLPAFSSTVQAGFPSPADDHIERRLDLNELVISHPAATFYVKVEGESMCDAGIHSGDILVVDRSKEPNHGKIVVAVINGEFTVKRFLVNKDGAWLAPENPAFSRIKVDSEADFQVWGVVTYIIHKT